jgi:cytochrome P450
MAELSDNGPQPGQVSWEQALGPNYLEDPYALTEGVLESCPPLFRAKPSSPRMGDCLWVATRFDVIREIFQNNDHYSTADNYPYFRIIGENLRAIPLQLDPPEHTKYRKFLEPWFAPKAVMALEPRIRVTVNTLIDGFVDEGACDASYDFSRVFPVQVFMDIMGFPREMFDDFLAWSHPMHFETHDDERMGWGTRGALDYMRSFIAQVRRSPPTDTLGSAIVHGGVEGRGFTDDELVGMIFFIWDGGMDTVAATSSLIFRRLAMDAEIQTLLRRNPGKMAVAIEEFLRMNPTVNTARTAKVDHVLEGQDIKRGDRLFCLVAAGNYDPDRYEDPRAFRIDRPQNRHLTFVAGAHRCLGINLARFELQIALSEFLRRIPTFRLKPEARCMAVPGLLGAPSVPIVWGGE